MSEDKVISCPMIILMFCIIAVAIFACTMEVIQKESERKNNEHVLVVGYTHYEKLNSNGSFNQLLRKKGVYCEPN